MKTKVLLAILFLSLSLTSCVVPHKSHSIDNSLAYFCFIDSTGYINFEEFISRNMIMPDNGVDAQALCLIEFEVINDGEIENIKVTSNCDYCNAAVAKAVELSAQYWKLMPLTNKKGIKVRYEYKYKIR